jgi:hypothetical protein
MPIPFLVSMAIGIAISFVGYLLMPKPKGPKLPSLSDLEDPTAESGRPIPVLFGSMTIQSPNNLGYWDKEMIKRKARSKKK